MVCLHSISLHPLQHESLSAMHLTPSTCMLYAARAHYHLRQCAVYVNLHFLNKPELAILRFTPGSKWFDEHGDLVDEYYIGRLKGVVDSLITWTERVKPVRKERQVNVVN